MVPLILETYFEMTKFIRLKYIIELIRIRLITYSTLCFTKYFFLSNLVLEAKMKVYYGFFYPSYDKSTLQLKMEGALPL